MKGNTTDRGYGSRHQKLREQWEPYVEAGTVNCHAIVCLMPDRWIRPGSEWHLGHTRDRTGWTGPEHAKCNLSEGGKRGGKKRTFTVEPKEPPDPGKLGKKRWRPRQPGMTGSGGSEPLW